MSDPMKQSVQPTRPTCPSSSLRKNDASTALLKVAHKHIGGRSGNGKRNAPYEYRQSSERRYEDGRCEEVGSEVRNCQQSFSKSCKRF